MRCRKTTMSNKNDHKSCPPENIVAYIYSEMEPAEIPAFERHLAECSACAEEFAAVSDARLSVFEWKRDAFDTLVVPQFEIPGKKPKVAVKQAGWLEAIFANVRVLAGAAAACAVRAIVAGLGFYFLQPADSNLNVAVAPVPISEKKVEMAEEQDPTPAQSKPELVNPEKKDAVAIKHRFTPIPVVVRTRKPRIANTMVAEVTPSPKQVDRKSVNRDRLPTLNNFEDAEDDSLRLADLLADVGARNDK